MVINYQPTRKVNILIHRNWSRKQTFRGRSSCSESLPGQDKEIYQCQESWIRCKIVVENRKRFDLAEELARKGPNSLPLDQKGKNIEIQPGSLLAPRLQRCINHCQLNIRSSRIGLPQDVCRHCPQRTLLGEGQKWSPEIGHNNHKITRKRDGRVDQRWQTPNHNKIFLEKFLG